jgi:hypothetical protein
MMGPKRTDPIPRKQLDNIVKCFPKGCASERGAFKHSLSTLQLRVVCQIHSCPMSPADNRYHRPSPQVPQHSGIASIGRADVSETQSTLLPFQVTCTYIYDQARISTNSPSLASPPSAQPSPSQLLLGEKTLLCYYYL